MEIHKPKPIHNWREFLKEYAIIVLGVATALAAEQAVEWLHWQSEVGAARKALREEIATIDGFYLRRIAIAPCIAKQEQEIKAILDGLDGKGKVALLSSFRNAVGLPMVDSEWQSQRSAQVLTHFPHAELALMNRYYSVLPMMAATFDAESAAWSELSIFQSPQNHLTPSDIARLRGQLNRAQRTEYGTILFAYRMLKVSDQLGVSRPKIPSDYADRICSQSEDQIEAGYLKDEMRP
ncbi:MAG: hypothetical protein JO256_07375 [Alphaproteobacteria bacterium]|nr:hypothetical protein [Alphaproteobacteria bacterium]